MDGCGVQTEKVISHILEIIYLMTGEEYMIVKKPLQYKCTPQVLEDLCESRKSVLEIPADSPVHVRKRRCHPTSWDTNGMPSKAQEFPDSSHVQIKCDDVAMYLSLEEWEYLEHHKEVYNTMIGKNQSSLGGPKGQCAKGKGFLSQLHSEQRDFNSNTTVDWNTESEFTAPNVSSITACENKSSPNRESADKIYRREKATGTQDSTHSRDVFALQNNLTLNHEALSEIFLETEIKEECMMEDCEDAGVRSNKYNHMDSPSLMDDHQLKTANAVDSSVESSYSLDLILPPFSENPQHTSLINGHQNKMAEFTDSGLLDGHTLDRIQSPFGEVLHRKGIKKGLRCSTVGQETKAAEVGDFSLKTNRSLSITNVFKDMPQTIPTRTGLQDKESSTDGQQAKEVAINDCPSVNEEAESISNIFHNVYDNDHIKIYQVHSLDETMKVEINDSSVEDCEALYQPSSSFTDRPQRTCIKTELICQEHIKNGHQEHTMDETNSRLVESPTLLCDTRTCIKTELIHQEHTMNEMNSRLVESYNLGADTSTLKYGLHKLAYQECLIPGQQPKAVEVNHSTPEYPYSPHTDWQANNKLLSSSSKTSSSQSTGRVQSRRKPTKMISCSECGKLFSSNSYLLRHQRLHTGEKPFTCSECGKSFSWRSSLVTHKRTHLGEKPFSCKQCGKKFSDYSGIIKHRRSHTGEKPYSCLVCGERFAQTYQLVKHQAVHLAEDVPEKPFNGW